MAKRAGWLGRLGNRLSRMEARLNERRAEVEAENAGAAPVPVTAPTAPAPPAAGPAPRIPTEHPDHLPYPPAPRGRPTR